MQPAAAPLEFKALDKYSYTLAAMDRVEQLAEFKIRCANESAYHPSLWSFLDEQDVRAAWWHPKNCHVWDVGAAYGSYTLPALANECTVVAWSPPYNVPEVAFEAAVLGLSLLENDYKRCCIDTDGVWSRDGWLAAFDDRNSQWFADESSARKASKTAFRVTKLDNVVGPPAWLKIDAEGAELEILHGAERTLLAHHPFVLLENHLHLDPQCDAKCEEYLGSLGYRKVGTMPHGIISHSFYEPR